jgi:hypothetical protein
MGNITSGSYTNGNLLIISKIETYDIVLISFSIQQEQIYCCGLKLTIFIGTIIMVNVDNELRV